MAKMMYRIVCVILSVLMLAPDIGHAETAGKIAGVIRDKATQDPLPGVNIKIVGTSLRAISGPYGEYFVLNVPIGVYAIEAQMMGYLTVQNSSVSVNADLTTRVNFSLHTTVLDLNETLTITAPRSLIRPDLTASSDVITADDLRPLPITSIADLITLQSGTVRDANGGLHIRGGRSDEISYYVDGTEFRDPMLGGMSTTLNLDTIEEVVINRGGFDAQYGDAMSGIVNIMTKEGATDYTGRFRSSLSLQPQYNVI
ncbi:MAG: TonB-dependent receptor, partial [Gemmatimonadota bacterium]|nr:TonB-dependent receptor [Gemmatimonadota bacterium]